MRDFSLEAYKALLAAIKSSKIPVFGVASWLQNKPVFGIMLRHDVDRKPLNALRVAELERESDIKSTYYFRVTKTVFDKNIIKSISRLGHEIGYHYEDLSLGKGCYDKAIELFKKHLEQLRAVVAVKTIAMHGRPFSTYNNKNLWQKYNCKDFGILAEAFLDVDYSNMYYLTDTGRTWGKTRANIRDNVETSLPADVDSTDSLISFITENTTKKIALVMHPERWEQNYTLWVGQLLKDIVVNIAKCIIAKFY